jgi:hypothetical protein
MRSRNPESGLPEVLTLDLGRSAPLGASEALEVFLCNDEAVVAAVALDCIAGIEALGAALLGGG